MPRVAMQPTTGRPSEAGHWYTRDGQPAYEVPDARGNLRPTTLRDARKLGLLPSVTTIIRCAAAPGLELWKQEQAILAALTLPRDIGESEQQWLERVRLDAKEQAKAAAERGTRIHEAVQKGLEGAQFDPQYQPHVENVKAALDAYFTPLRWKCELPFSSPLGFGGKVDLMASDADLPGGLIVVDIKTTDKPIEDVRTWDEHAMQLSAYTAGSRKDLPPDFRCAILYVQAVTGEARVLPLYTDDVFRGWECFKALLAFYQAKTGHRP